MLELATLGILQSKPLHGYRLKQQLEQFMSGCISVNYGAIYPLLRRLEERGDIATLIQEAGEAGPSRKIYCITSQGTIAFRRKMLEHPHESWVNARSRFIIKYFFFSHLESIERIKLLEHRIMVCRLRLESLEVQPIPSDDFYEIAVWHRFIAVIKEELDWLNERLVLEQQQELESRN